MMSVVGSGAAAAAACGVALASPALAPAMALAYAAAFCTKLSDTCASEVGKAYGRTTYLSTTLARVPRGTEGAVSLEGTAAGVAASALMAAVAAGSGLVGGLEGAGACVVAAFAANWVESVLGATLQDDVPWLTNDIVNVINTAVGAVLAVALGAAVGAY